MKKQSLFVFLFAITLAFSSCNTASDRQAAGSAEEETVNKKNTEWVSLFNGTDLTGWRSFQSDSIFGWTVEDGCLTALGLGGDLSGDIITTGQYASFELSFEWKISPGGNSGVMFHVLEGDHKTTYETGPEYQLLDDVGFPEPIEDWQKAGANYAMHVAETKTLKPVGEFNTTRILVDGSHVEHWLNGEKLLEYELWSDDWNKRKAEGKWIDYPDYGMAKTGHIAFQDHGNKTWFRNIRIRVIE